MHCCAACTFQEIINAGYYKQLVTVYLKMDHALVGVDNLLKVYRLIHDVYE